MISIKKVITLLVLLLTSLFVHATDNNQLNNLTLSETQSLLTSKKLTLMELAEYYQQRIQLIDDSGINLNSVALISPDLEAQIARIQLKIDSDEKLGSLFGAFVLVKDNIDVKSVPNTAGSIHLRQNIPTNHAPVISQIINDDAIILGRTTLSEWANFRSTYSSSGWSSMYGQTHNPYDVTRSPCGSSSGSGVSVAADLTLMAIGTETDGSVVCPSAINGVVGFKPTVGLVSRSGIIPISHTQDTAGSMARTVTDAVKLLNSMQGVDHTDETSISPISLLDALDKNRIKGMRIGIVRNLSGYNDELDARFEQELKALEKAGAILVDNANIETIGKWSSHEYSVLLTEFHYGLNKYFSRSQNKYSLSSLIKLNTKLANQAMPVFGQEIFISAINSPGIKSTEYIAHKKQAKQLAGEKGIDATLAKYKVDVLVAPTTSPAWKIDHVLGDHYTGSASSAAAVAGYPHITVPMGLIRGLPVGMSFFSGHLKDAVVVSAAYGYEQASLKRVPPKL